MLRLLLWLFSKKRFTHADVIILCIAMTVGGWKGLIILFGGFFVCTLIGGFAEAWRDDTTRGGL